MLSLINVKNFNQLPPTDAFQSLKKMTSLLSRQEVLNLAKTITKRVKTLNKQKQEEFIALIISEKAGSESLDDIALGFKMAGKTSEKEWRQWLTRVYATKDDPDPYSISFKEIKDENDNGLWRLFFNNNEED